MYEPEEYCLYIITCFNCKRKEEFKDETIEDCWWQADVGGWVDVYEKGNVKSYCQRCANLILPEEELNQQKR